MRLLGVDPLLLGSADDAPVVKIVTVPFVWIPYQDKTSWLFKQYLFKSTVQVLLAKTIPKEGIEHHVVVLKLNLLGETQWYRFHLFCAQRVGFFLGYNTCVSPHRHYLLSCLSVCLCAGDFTEQETLSLWLCPSQSVAINHLKWAVLTGSWPHHSFISFYLFFPLQIAPSSSWRQTRWPQFSLSPPHNPHRRTTFQPPSQMRKWPGVKTKTNTAHLLYQNLYASKRFPVLAVGVEQGKECNGHNSQWCRLNLWRPLTSTHGVPTWAFGGCAFTLDLHVKPLAYVSFYNQQHGTVLRGKAAVFLLMQLKRGKNGPNSRWSGPQEIRTKEVKLDKGFACESSAIPSMQCLSMGPF